MYITPSLSDTVLSFTLKDRYGNTTPNSLGATLERDRDPIIPVNFVNGIYSSPRKTGYYTIRARELENNTLTYADKLGSYTLTGVSYASLYVPPTDVDFSFLPDYNARYTIFSGDSYLRQSENILYDVSPGQSSSLAVSTLLDSPYRQDQVLSLIPG